MPFPVFLPVTSLLAKQGRGGNYKSNFFRGVVSLKIKNNFYSDLRAGPIPGR